VKGFQRVFSDSLKCGIMELTISDDFTSTMSEPLISILTPSKSEPSRRILQSREVNQVVRFYSQEE
jgi:hypothetical protein